MRNEIVVNPTSLSSITTVTRHRTNLVLVMLFVFGIAFPFTGLWRSGNSHMIEQVENRRIAKFPDLELKRHGLIQLPSKQTMLIFPKSFEAWFNDHLGGRRNFWQMRNLAVVSGLMSEPLIRPKQEQSRCTNVIIGDDGWLFTTIDKSIDDYRRTRPLTVAQLDDWKQVLEGRQRWCESRGIRYVFMLGPNSQSINGEKIPKRITQVGAQSRFDQLLGHLSGNSKLPIVDPRSRLVAGKANWPTYHKTDTHWNDYGAFLGYRELCETLRHWYPQLQPWEISDFDVTVTETDGGDLAPFVESSHRFPESRVTLIPKRARLAERLSESAEAREPSHSGNAQGELGRVVILHDSFMLAMAPYLSEHCQSARYHWVEPYDFPCELIESERPVLVIQEMVERRFMIDNPENPPVVDADLQQQIARQPGSKMMR